MVVAHHSSLAYTTFAKFDNKAYINSTHPIVDTQRWIGLDIFENFNDVFFMSLMFLIAGLFMMKSIHKKGRAQFIRDRFYRLFIPFLFLGTLLMLLAYYPSYYMAHQSGNLIGYVKDFFVVEKWPVGPPWFVWVLFIFNLLFAIFYSLFQKLSDRVNPGLNLLKNKPFGFFILLFFITWILYVPVAYQIGAGRWTGLGPFDFQLSRILLYFGYFALGVIIGNTDFNNELFSSESRIVKYWWLWILLSLFIYGFLTTISKPLGKWVGNGKIKEFYGWMIYYFIYAASCTLSCIAFITTFKKLIITGRNWWNSLSENAYLIYLIHYIFVVWCQFLLLNFYIPAFIKFLITFLLALSLSWIVSSLLRKIKYIKKYL